MTLLLNSWSDDLSVGVNATINTAVFWHVLAQRVKRENARIWIAQILQIIHHSDPNGREKTKYAISTTLHWTFCKYMISRFLLQNSLSKPPHISLFFQYKLLNIIHYPMHQIPNPNNSSILYSRMFLQAMMRISSISHCNQS